MPKSDSKIKMMAKETELIRKQQEVRDGILALKEQIPSARILNALGKAFKRNSLGYWLSSVALLNFILLSPWALIGLALNEIGKTTPIFVTIIMGVEGVVLSFCVAHIALQTILDDIANRINDKFSNVDDLSQMLLWLMRTLSMRNVFTFALLFCLMWVLLGVPAMSIPIRQFIGFGLSLTTFVVGLVAGIAGYLYLWTCLLVSSFKAYQYDMNAFSPADSEIINNISEMMTKAIYMLAGLSAVITFILTSSLLYEQTRAIFSFPVLVLGWTAIIAQFLLTRSTLGVITNRAKWKTLNRIQRKINSLEATGDLSEKDTVERLLRFADLHQQIMASKTNTLDLKSFSTLFSQLMLPLFGLLLGNLDRLLELLR